MAGVRVESVYKGQEMRIGVLSSGPALPEPELSDMFVGFVEGKHNMDTYSSRLAMYLARNSVGKVGRRHLGRVRPGNGYLLYRLHRLVQVL